MKPFYWRGTTNFGDYMNEWMWPQILDGYLNEDDNIRLVGVGSLLKDSLNFVQGKKVIFGTGSGYGAIPNRDDFEDWLFYFVRGPRTAKLFNLPPEKSIIDGAWMLSQIPQYQTIPSKKGTSFIPHWTTSEVGNWQKVCKKAGFNYIDPLGELENILKSIASSELVITESLHGAILADYFRTPWVPVSISPEFLSFKWVDWFESIELDADIRKLPYSDFFEYIYNKSIPSKKDFSLGNEVLSSPIKESLEISSHKPSFLYPYKTIIKSKGKQFRSSSLRNAQFFRNSFLFSRWNESHQDKVVAQLMKIKMGPSFISKDMIRKDRIDKLSGVIDKLKFDYDQGVLFR